MYTYIIYYIILYGYTRRGVHFYLRTEYRHENKINRVITYNIHIPIIHYSIGLMQCALIWVCGSSGLHTARIYNIIIHNLVDKTTAKTHTADVWHMTWRYIIIWWVDKKFVTCIIRLKCSKPNIPILCYIRIKCKNTLI